jgi:hypothetical protein
MRGGGAGVEVEVEVEDGRAEGGEGISSIKAALIAVFEVGNETNYSSIIVFR